MMASDKQYKRNFLTDVIFKIDFPPILELQENSPVKFQNSIIASFPILEPLKQFGFKIENKGGADFTTENVPAGTLWRFKSVDSKRIIELNSNSLVIVEKDYKNYTDFKKIISQVTEPFLKSYPEISISRLGLRYINQLDIEGTNFFKWEGFVNQSLIANLDFVEDKQQLRRIIQAYEIAVGQDTMLNFRCGIFNSSYPGEIIKKEFILDYDCYTQIGFEKEEMLSKLDKYNEIITEFFEKSIDNDLRKLLNK